MMKPKYPKRDKISNPVVEYRRKPVVREEEALREAQTHRLRILANALEEGRA
jgi:hypothetical protein